MNAHNERNLRNIFSQYSHILPLPSLDKGDFNITLHGAYVDAPPFQTFYRGARNTAKKRQIPSAQILLGSYIPLASHEIMISTSIPPKSHVHRQELSSCFFYKVRKVGLNEARVQVRSYIHLCGTYIHLCGTLHVQDADIGFVHPDLKMLHCGCISCRDPHMYYFFRTFKSLTHS